MMKALAAAVLILAAVPAKADTLFTNIGQPGATTYPGDQFGLVEQGLQLQRVRQAIDGSDLNYLPVFSIGIFGFVVLGAGWWRGR